MVRPCELSLKPTPVLKKFNISIKYSKEWVSEFMASQDAKLSIFEADFKQQQSEMTNKIDTALKAITDRIAGTLPINEPDVEQEEGNLKNTNFNPQPQPNQFPSIATEQVRKINSMLESLGLVSQSSNTKFVCSKEDAGEVMFIEIIRDDNEPMNEGPNKGEGETTEESVVEYFDTFPTRDGTNFLGTNEWPIPSIFLRNLSL
ncbi:hypothetical protein Tco_0086707 [Tanacetum coccineum]